MLWLGRKDRTTGKGKEIGNLSLGRKLRLYSPPQSPSRGKGKAERICIHPIKVYSGALVYKPPQGGKKGMGEKEGFPQGFVEWSDFLLFGVLSNVTRKTFDCIQKVGLQSKPLIVFTPLAFV